MPRAAAAGGRAGARRNPVIAPSLSAGPAAPVVPDARPFVYKSAMPVTRRALESQKQASEDTNDLLRQILEQQKQILAALEKLAAK
jgi:hypothetical protein